MRVPWIVPVHKYRTYEILLVVIKFDSLIIYSRQNDKFVEVYFFDDYFSFMVI